MPGCTNQADKNSNIITLLVTIIIMLLLANNVITKSCPSKLIFFPARS